MQPVTLESLNEIKGMTKEKIKKYGNDIIEIIKKSIAEKETTSTTPAVIKVKHSRKTGKKVNKPPKIATAPVVPVPKPKIKPSAPLIATTHTFIYILLLKDNKIYVGKTSNLTRRTDDHMNNKGSMWTKMYPPTGVTLPRLGNIEGDGDAAERDETLKYMYKYGVQNVRGWRYVQLYLDLKEKAEIEMEIRENMELCRRCGKKGHFIKNCKETHDRLGNMI
jgi:predicted GIY-YIG superfamily endonuclease